MNAERFDDAMQEWVAREERAAPPLVPSEAVRRRLAECRRRQGRFPLWGWLAAAAGLAGLALLLRTVLGPSADHIRLESWRVEHTIAFEGAALGPPTRGMPKAFVPFAQLILQRHRPGATVVEGFDLLARDVPAVELAPGELYRLGLLLNTSCHVLLLQIDGRSTVVRLFPNAAYGPGANPVSGREPQYLPAEPGWWVLDDARGAETLYAVAARAPLPEIEAMLAEPSAGERLRATLDVLARQRPDEVAVVSIPLQVR